MARMLAFMLAAAALFGATQAMAADGDVRTCALTRGIQCLPNEECQDLTMAEMGLPTFVRVDLNNKTISSLDKDIPRSSKIASIERLQGVVVLHGTELRGWSAAVAEESGALTLSASGDSEGFIVFGSCVKP
jgi:hypothetical protein